MYQLFSAAVFWQPVEDGAEVVQSWGEPVGVMLILGSKRSHRAVLLYCHSEESEGNTDM